MQRAACRGADLAIFLPGDAFDDDNEDDEHPSKEALSYCLRCPVLADCLTHAVALDLSGVWGGTTEYQRRQLRRPMSRQSCPVCGGQIIRTVADSEVCGACGASWRIR
jgi:hypothetical protein